jgi:hypothetical protein
MRTFSKRVKTTRRTRKRRGGEFNYKPVQTNLGMCKYNINDPNVRISTEDPYELQRNYQTCCPKSRFGFKNSSPFCKKLANQFKMLQEAKNYETKQVFEKDNSRYMNHDEDEDYYKPRNAITHPEEEEFGPEFQGKVNELGGRKPRKSRKSRKSRK